MQNHLDISGVLDIIFLLKYAYTTPPVKNINYKQKLSKV